MSSPTRPHRYLEFAFLCDAASDKGGALDALGIGTTMIHARGGLPALHQSTLVIRVAWMGEVESGSRHLVVEVVDPDGVVIAALQGDFTVADPSGERLSPAHRDIPVGANLIFPITMPLTKPGLHHVRITLDDDSYTPLPLKVIVG